MRATTSLVEPEQRAVRTTTVEGGLVSGDADDIPSFFDEAPRLTLYDPLSAFLGATQDELVEYRYLDAVKLAGHSCSTMAGVCLMTLRALEADGLVRLDGTVLAVEDHARVLVRTVASAFDAYLGASDRTFSRAV